MKELFIILFLSVALAGCSTTQLIAGRQLPKVEGDYATLVIKRSSELRNRALTILIKYNNESLLSIEPGDCVRFRIPIIDTNLSAQIIGEGYSDPTEKEISFIPDNGSVYYFFTKIISAGRKLLTVELMQIPENLWKREANECNWTDLE